MPNSSIRYWYMMHCLLCHLEKESDVVEKRAAYLFPRAYNKSPSWCVMSIYFLTQFETLDLIQIVPESAQDFSLCPYAITGVAGTVRALQV